MKIHGYLVFLTLLAISSCATKKKVVEKQNQSSLYNPGTSYLHPEYLVFHQSDSISQLILKINTSDLLFNEANPEHKQQAKIKIQYTLNDITDDPDNKAIADSATIEKKVEKVADKNVVFQTYFVKALYGRNYSLKVVLYDLLRGSYQLSYVYVNKLTKYSAQNFKAISAAYNSPLFRRYIIPNEGVRFYTNRSGITRCYIRYNKDDTPLPPPPFSVQTEPKYIFNTDSIWVIPYNQQKSFLFQYRGNYLFQVDSLQTESFYLINAGPSFPKVQDADMMIPPLEYLTTTEEFASLKKRENPKSAVDNYWLKAGGGSVETARELIRIFYNRMYYANLFFTSYKQGWKTDRGMIYMIFGAPSYISKTASGETWQYYIKQDGSNLTIVFNKTASPYSENHYVMKRDDSYARFWRTAIDSWRKGKAYNLEE